MTTWKKWAIAGPVLLLIAAGGEILWIHHKNHEGDEPVKKAEYVSDPDDLVFLKSEHPMSLKDEKDLKGRTLWVSAGGQMDYYLYTGHTVDYAHSQGTLLSTEKLDVKDAVEASAPKSAAFRIPQGDKQVLLVFTKPDDPAHAKEYAVPVGYREGGTYTLMTDQIFFYDDPHKLFSYWKPEFWKAIDEHRAVLGMSERQVQTALGQISDPHGDRIGDRVVVYADNGHPKRVTFENGKATKIEDVPSM